MPESLKDLMRTLPQVGRVEGHLVATRPSGRPGRRDSGGGDAERGWWGTATGAHGARVGGSPSSRRNCRPSPPSRATLRCAPKTCGETSWSLGSRWLPSRAAASASAPTSSWSTPSPAAPAAGWRVARARGLQRHAGDGRDLRPGAAGRRLQGGRPGGGPQRRRRRLSEPRATNSGPQAAVAGAALQPPLASSSSSASGGSARSRSASRRRRGQRHPRRRLGPRRLCRARPRPVRAASRRRCRARARGRPGSPGLEVDHCLSPSSLSSICGPPESPLQVISRPRGSRWRPCRGTGRRSRRGAPRTAWSRSVAAAGRRAVADRQLSRPRSASVTSSRWMGIGRTGESSARITTTMSYSGTTLRGPVSGGT